MSFPTPAQIEEMFKLREIDPIAFSQHFDVDMTMTIVGHEFELGGEIKGLANVMSQHVGVVHDMLDLENNPHDQTIVRVIGGGESDWACVELTSKTVTKAGKTWNHDHVYIIHFTPEDKIDIMRAYYDTGHLNDHIADTK